MAIDVEKILRNLPTEEKILRSSRRVQVIKAVDCIIALSKYNMDTQAVKNELQKLLETYKLVRVKVNENNSRVVDLSISKALNASDHYMWAEDKKEYLNIFIAVLIIALLFLLAMYQVWPAWLKSLSGYLKYVVMAFIVFLIVTGIVRLIVYTISSFTHPPGLWIFPNLFAECGVIESFIPLYSWDDEDVSHKKQ